MQKSGTLVYKALITLILSAIIVASFVTVGNQYGSAEAPHKQAVANDLALILTEMQAMPGDLTLAYGQDVSRYGILLSGNSILIYSAGLGRTDIIAGKAAFNGKPLPQTLIERPSSLIIIKKGDVITLSSA
ncbi:TPA: hypothetical protein HA228_00265 [Candidatus Woesearchaeota archaeon]|nr:MAG: hypothetical protein QT04_C0018G0010 [archaeon GW2011_AR11]HIH04635.1 hypothetical protein [Candidatus Woesearchaeota archaeon]HII64951.1 hypothetical protein [Candidatus Woesearchaeota archaeon]